MINGCRLAQGRRFSYHLKKGVKIEASANQSTIKNNSNTLNLFLVCWSVLLNHLGRVVPMGLFQDFHRKKVLGFKRLAISPTSDHFWASR